MIKMNEIIIENYINEKNPSKIIISPAAILYNNDKKDEKNSFAYTEIKSNENHNEILEFLGNNINIIKLNKTFFFNFSNLTNVTISNNMLSKIPKKIVYLSNLRVLNLNNNLISTIPSYLSELKNLEELYLNKNVIKRIPSLIEQLSNLKILELSNNHINELPIEFGLLKNLENLCIDNNEFIEIPCTLCYLKYLKTLKLEWFEFLEPQYSKEIKDEITIHLIQSSFKEMISKSILFCDFSTFVLKFSRINNHLDDSFNTFETEKTECYKFNTPDIFYAIENNYIGIIKSLINNNEDILSLKNTSGKSPLYISIQQNKKEIYDFILSKMNLKNNTNSYLYLHKAIRTRNYNLIYKLYNCGANMESVDEKGNNCYHILFSVFYKNFEECCLIGNFFIDHKIKGLNALNYEGWAPIHIAAKYASIKCLKWILSINENLKKNNETFFDINFKGKNNWTPLNLSLSSYKYNETMLLINNGANIFSRTKEGKIMKNITNNFFLTKMLNNKENEYYYKKYYINNNINNNFKNKLKNQINLTTNNYYKSQLNDSDLNCNLETTKAEILLNPDINLSEKFRNLMVIKLSNNKDDIENSIYEIFENINILNKKFSFIICEICDLIIEYQLVKMLPYLNDNLKKIKDKKNLKYLYKNINNAINYLENIQNNKFQNNIFINYLNSNNDKNNKGKSYNNKNLFLNGNFINSNNLVSKHNTIKSFELNKTIKTIEDNETVKELEEPFLKGKNNFKQIQQKILDNSEEEIYSETILQENDFDSLIYKLNNLNEN